ncbi:MAG: hypothetical protein JSS53_10340 [Proteobacteria bacterium]|nr:hypothetical protein [Pseudomonadota bacterium]
MNRIVTHTSCVYMVSLGHSQHVGKSLKKDFEKLINMRFKKIDILIADTLQAKSLIVREQDKDITRLIEDCKASGYEWENRHKDIISQLPDSKVYHWEDITSHPNYLHYLSSVKEMYFSDDEFKNILNSSIYDYLIKAKILEHEEKLNFDKLPVKLSIDYVLEECAAIYIQAELGHSYLAYPNVVNPAICYILSYKIQAHNPNLLKLIVIDQKKNIERELYDVVN